VKVISSAGRGLCAFSFLVALGLLAVTLGVPAVGLAVGLLALIVGLVAATLPFAFVGLVVWGAYQTATAKPKRALQNLGVGVATLGYWLVALPSIAFLRLGAWSIGAGRAVATKALPMALRTGEAARQGVVAGVVLVRQGANATGEVLLKAKSGGRFGNMAFETFAGAAAGGLLVILFALSQRGATFGLPILGGVAAGGLIGLLVGAAQPSRVPDAGSSAGAPAEQNRLPTFAKVPSIR
jgi:hypothetical protein